MKLYHRPSSHRDHPEAASLQTMIHTKHHKVPQKVVACHHQGKCFAEIAFMVLLQHISFCIQSLLLVARKLIYVLLLSGK